MNLQEVFDQLAEGELGQLSIGGQAAGVINGENAARVARHVNLALTTLFTRFSLKEGRLVLQPVAGKAVYAIDSKFAVNKKSSREAVRYLIDTPEAPFVDDVLKIERVLTDMGRDLALNNEANQYSVFTPSATTVRLPLDVVNQASNLPDELKTEHFELVYRASHPKIVLTEGLDDFSRVQLQLPQSHLEPLLYFVASRLHFPTGMSAQTNAGDPYMAKYELCCQGLENKGLQVDNPAAFDKLRSRGWV